MKRFATPTKRQMISSARDGAIASSWRAALTHTSVAVDSSCQYGFSVWP